MSNAIQLRDSSDVTTMRKNKAIQQNYNQLLAKNTFPLGGIPNSDLLRVARRDALYIPYDSLIATVTFQPSCPECPNIVTYTTTQIAVRQCNNCSGSSIQTYPFQQVQAVNNNYKRA